LLASLQALVKSVLITFIGVLVTFTSPFPFIFGAVCLSIVHFVCLFLGYTAAVALELVRIEFGPGLKFWLGLLFPNALFGAALNTLFAMGVPSRPVLELSPVTTVLVVTNLIPVLLVAACSCIVQRINGAWVPRVETA